MKRKIIIIASAIFSFFALCIIGLIIFYNLSLREVSRSATDNIVFVVESGTSSKNIINSLYEKNLIRNKIVGYVYLKMHGSIILQAGVYDLNKSMSLPEIIDNISNGKVVDNSISITFIEGKRLSTYVEQISEAFPYSKDEILEKIEDKTYLEDLIDKYWFLTDEILDDKLYYALEGYLYPNTYQFSEDSSIENIIEKMLDATGSILDNYREEIEQSGYTVHEILSMASIIELEAVTKDDRSMVSQVIHKRLDIGMTLGMDVTSYYGVQKNMSEELTVNDLSNNNPYNTRVIYGLPIGPICNSNVESVFAVFSPSETNYLYFYADIKTGKVYFAETESEFYELIKKYSV